MFYPSIVENIARNSILEPERLCMADEKKALSYREVWEAVYGLSKELKNRGLMPEQCVVIECNQSVDYMVCEFAIQLAGGIFVPLENHAAASRAVEIAQETEAHLYIADKEREELGADSGLCPGGYLDLAQATDFAEAADPEQVAFPDEKSVSEILFSTGTTGKSKGIVLTHRNDVALAENVCYGVKMKKGNVELIPMPTSHSHGLRRSYGNLCNGSSIVYVDGVMFLKKVFQMMDDYHVTSMDLSPSILNIFFKLSKDRLGDYAEVLDYIQLGSAPLSEEDKEHLSRILPKTRLYNFYGSTEAGCSCLMDFNEASKPKGCIGKPAVNARFIVVDENHKEIQSSPDNLGFLASAGPINMKEYFKAPELTEEAMPDGEYIYTKDLGYIDEDGYVYMLGRKDDVINYGGVKISPEEIESMVRKNDIVKDCACIPVTDKLTGQAPKLYIALEDGAEYEAKAFKAFLEEVLDANKQPKFIELIDEIPRTFNGKILRKQLVALNEK